MNMTQNYEEKAVTGVESEMLSRPTRTYIEFLELIQTDIWKKAGEIVADLNKDLVIYQERDNNNPDASGMIRVRDNRTSNTMITSRESIQIMQLVKPLAFSIDDHKGYVYVVCPKCGMIHTYEGDRDIDLNYAGKKTIRCRKYDDEFNTFFIGGIVFDNGDLKLFDSNMDEDEFHECNKPW